MIATDPGTSPRLGALSELMEAVCLVYQLEPVDLLGRSRTKAVAEARALLCLLARRCTRLSFPELGIFLGRDHTTVMALVRTAERMVARDPWIAGAMAELLERFGAGEDVRRH